MSPNKRLILILAALLIASLSCDYLPSPNPDPGGDSADAIATSVAATLAAGSGDGSPAEPPASASPEPEAPAPAALRTVYVKDGNVYSWQPGGMPALLAAAGDAFDIRLSDDGSAAAFTRGPDWYNQELWAVNSDGSGLRQLVSQATLTSYITQPDAISARIYQFDFIPGTHDLAFNTQLTFEGPGLFLNDDLRVVNADTSTLVTVLPPGSGGNFYYAPDGSRIGLSTPTQVSLVNPDGSGRSDVLTYPYVITYSEYLYYPPLVWKPDGSAIRVVIPPQDPLAASPDQTRIWHLPADGSAPSLLMAVNAVPFFFHVPAISGDSSRTAYLVEITPGSPPILELHLANVDGSGDTVYATGDLQFRGWSKDGLHFVYTDGSPNPKIGEYGVAPISLGAITNLIGLEWVDSSRFLFQNNNGTEFRLWMGEIGLPPVLIDSTPGDRIIFDHNF